MAGTLPDTELPQRRPQDEARERLDQPGLLGERNELAGRHQSVHRMLPAHQRLDADDGARVEPQLRLVVQQQLVARECLPQLAEALEARRAVVVALAVEQLELGAQILCRIHRRVGAAQQRGGVATVVRVAGDADRCLDVHRDAAQQELAVQRAAEATGDLEARLGAVAAADEDGELVTAEACEQIRVADLAPKALGDLAQQLVAALVPEDVVDLLEAVEVDEQQREAIGSGGAVHLVLQAHVEVAAVGKPGQLVVQRAVEVLVGLEPQRRFERLALVRAALGLLQQRLLGAPQFGHVEHHAVDRQWQAVLVALDRSLLPDPQQACRRRRTSGTRSRTAWRRRCTPRPRPGSGHGRRGAARSPRRPRPRAIARGSTRARPRSAGSRSAA